MAEWWYNTNYHTAIAMTPFEALYGYKPSHLGLAPYTQRSVVGVEHMLAERQHINQHLKLHLTRAQERMKTLADRHRRDIQFQVGDYMYLKLKPYRQMTMRKRKVWKLSLKYAGPFKILTRVGELAYRLELPSEARIHPVFHVSILKKRVGATSVVTETLPPFDKEGKVILQPVKILERRIVKRNNAAMPQILVQWAHLPEEEATWEDYEVITKKFPLLDP